MKSSMIFAMALVIVVIASASAVAVESLTDQIKSLEPIIGSFPPNINNEKEANAVKKRYEAIKTELDTLLVKSPYNKDLLFMRGHLQNLGHNFDYPGALQGATDDLRALLKANPDHIPGIIELANLWVNSDPKLAPNAEQLFRGAQCYYGNQPLEVAQRGVFFALYYQGKMKEAFKQSEYLKKTWPQNAEYERLSEMTRNVLIRANQGTNIAEPTSEKLIMATCAK